MLIKVYLLEDKVDGAPGVDVHKVNFSVVIDELGAPRHSVREAALNLQRHVDFRTEVLINALRSLQTVTVAVRSCDCVRNCFNNL